MSAVGGKEALNSAQADVFFRPEADVEKVQQLESQAMVIKKAAYGDTITHLHAIGRLHMSW